MYILSQIFGFGAVISLFISYQQKKRVGFLTCKLAADVCWTGHYFLLGAFAGMIPNFVGIFREIIFMNSEKRKWASSPLWLAGFLCLNLTLGIFNYSTYIDLLPIIASVFVTVSMWIKRLSLAKLTVSVACILFWIYNFSIGSLVGVTNESISLISISIFFIRRKDHE